ncbi:hypothetical protein L6164_003232 [Bauhinia variegata]|uniref:Uncharacterized protein n=1 Tax=Bauhinia variegata TaxID=167791 RepID=A0ACB9Q2Z1_BAUVA|nr:hypothetical protein L6164_003232 [Bauhinia variegata]
MYFILKVRPVTPALNKTGLDHHSLARPNAENRNYGGESSTHPLHWFRSAVFFSRFSISPESRRPFPLPLKFFWFIILFFVLRAFYRLRSRLAIEESIKNESERGNQREGDGGARFRNPHAVSWQDGRGTREQRRDVKATQEKVVRDHHQP